MQLWALLTPDISSCSAASQSQIQAFEKCRSVIVSFVLAIAQRFHSQGLIYSLFLLSKQISWLALKIFISVTQSVSASFMTHVSHAFLLTSGSISLNSVLSKILLVINFPDLQTCDYVLQQLPSESQDEHTETYSPAPFPVCQRVLVTHWGEGLSWGQWVVCGAQNGCRKFFVMSRIPCAYEKTFMLAL